LIAYVFKTFSVKDLARFLEVYGIPPRLGRHSPNASDEDKRRLLAAARLLGTDAAAIIPENMQIDLLETKSNTSSGTAAFLGPIEWWDRQVSKVVLGQTSSSEGSGGDYKASSQHQTVRLDIAAHDATNVEETIVRDLIKIYVDLNYGPRRRYTSVTFAVPAAEDLTRFSTAIVQLVDRGLEVEQEQVRERMGLSEPEAGKPLLRPAGKQNEGAAKPTEPADPEETPPEADPEEP
jgi:phage gp29-like protein